MARGEDLGKRFGRLTTIRYIPGSKTKPAKYECECICGNIIQVRTADLRNGHTQSCGCLAKELFGQLNYKDLTGQKFGKLLAIEDTNKRNCNQSVIWKCLCDCGNYCEVDSHSLLTKHTQSCGCLTSRGEAKIQSILLTANIPFEKEVQVVLDDGSIGRFDFYVNNQYYIEYDGKQHEDENNPWYRPEVDIKKNEYCKEHNIPLIRIPYTKYDTLTINDLVLDEKEKQDGKYI